MKHKNKIISTVLLLLIFVDICNCLKNNNLKSKRTPTLDELRIELNLKDGKTEKSPMSKHLECCGIKLTPKPKKDPGHYEKIVKHVQQYFWVNDTKPSGLPGALVVSKKEALQNLPNFQFKSKDQKKTPKLLKK